MFDAYCTVIPFHPSHTLHDEKMSSRRTQLAAMEGVLCHGNPTSLLYHVTHLHTDLTVQVSVVGKLLQTTLCKRWRLMKLLICCHTGTFDDVFLLLLSEKVSTEA